MIVARITSRDSDSLVVGAAVVADTEISEIIAIVTIVDVVETEDGWEMVVAAAVAVRVVAVSEVVNEDVREVVLMTVSIANAVRTIATGVPQTMRRVEAIGRIHPAPMFRKIGTKMLTEMCHTQVERMRVWRRLRR